MLQTQGVNRKKAPVIKLSDEQEEKFFYFKQLSKQVFMQVTAPAVIDVIFDRIEKTGGFQVALDEYQKRVQADLAEFLKNQ